MWEESLEVTCRLTSNLLITSLAVGRPNIPMMGLNQVSGAVPPPGTHHGGIGVTPGRLRRPRQHGVSSQAPYDKLSPDQVHGKVGAKFKLTLLFHSKVCSKRRRLATKTAVGKNLNHMK